MHGLLEELLTWLKETPYAHERLGHCGSHHLNNTTLANAQRSWRTTNFGFIRVASFAMFTGSRLGKWQVNVELYAFMCEVRRPTVGGKQWEAMLLGGCAAEPYPWHPRRKHWKANPTHLTAYKNKQRREKSRLWRRRHRHTCGESAAIEPELGVWKSSIAPSCPVSELERSETKDAECSTPMHVAEWSLLQVHVCHLNEACYATASVRRTEAATSLHLTHVAETPQAAAARARFTVVATPYPVPANLQRISCDSATQELQ